MLDVFTRIIYDFVFNFNEYIYSCVYMKMFRNLRSDNLIEFISRDALN